MVQFDRKYQNDECLNLLNNQGLARVFLVIERTENKYSTLRSERRHHSTVLMHCHFVFYHKIILQHNQGVNVVINRTFNTTESYAKNSTEKYNLLFLKHSLIYI